MQLDHNLNESRWRAPTQQSNFSEDTMVRLRGTRAVAGELEIALRWNDHNDLDLHVKCPCGTEIYFRNRTCPTCKGHLDVDMNVGSNVQDKPVEHIRFGDKDCPALPGTYLFWVVYYSGPKGNGGPSTEYLLEVKNSQTLKIGEFRGTVSESNKSGQQFTVTIAEGGSGIPFHQHVEATHATWARGFPNSSAANVQRNHKIWLKARPFIDAQKRFTVSDNTPQGDLVERDLTRCVLCLRALQEGEHFSATANDVSHNVHSQCFAFALSKGVRFKCPFRNCQCRLQTPGTGETAQLTIAPNAAIPEAAKPRDFVQMILAAIL
eukprot:c16966_g1_i2.p1 GENE.c16966_g1_i2~~c16966_g1_i2.p1  ORF type:complete len:321 (-),score=42.00 c16966_g1_i2:51-1013(-)